MDATPIVIPASLTSTPLSKNMSTKVFSDSAKKQKKKAAKMLLGGFEGLQPQWPALTPELHHKVIHLLSDFFTEKHFKRLSTKEKTFLKGDNLDGEDEAKAVKLRAHEKAVESLKSELVFGINEVTRSLERDQVCLVIADRSVKPFFMISHLVSLAASRKCPAVAIDDLAVKLGEKIGVTSLVAFGFKRISPSCRTLISDIVSLLGIPSLDLFRLPEPSSNDNLNSQLTAQLQIEEKKEVNLTFPQDSLKYKPLLIKSQFKDPERTQKLAARRKKPATNADATGQKERQVNRKRKAKTVKIGKKHRKSSTT